MTEAPGSRSADGLASARVWLFDFDNTLVALEPEVDWTASRVELERYLRQAGVADAIFAEVPKGNLPLYEQLRGRLTEGPGAGLFRNPRDAVSFATLLAGASALIEAYELRGVARALPLPGASGLLRAVKTRGAALGIVTSNSSRTVRNWLERHGLTAAVDFIVGRDTLLPLKPAPEMVVRALTLCASVAAEAVFVGRFGGGRRCRASSGGRFLWYRENRRAAGRTCPGRRPRDLRDAGGAGRAARFYDVLATACGAFSRRYPGFFRVAKAAHLSYTPYRTYRIYVLVR